MSKRALRLLLWLLPLAWSGNLVAEVPLPQIPKAKAERCVEDPQFMRLNHMDLLRHKRDETVQRGDRDPRFSLKNCINCHVTPDTQGRIARVSEPDHFCSTCHRYAAVQIDCFQCHSDKPEPGVSPVASR